MNHRILPVVLLAAASASCQSMKEGLVALEARALVLDDAEIDEVRAGSSFSEEDVDLEGYGLHVAVMTPILDVIGGVDQREYGDEDTPEATIGLRRRFLEIWRLHPYVEGNLRYGFDLDTGVDSEDYTGYSFGLGALLDLTDHVYLNVRVVQEVTPVEVNGDEIDIEGLVGTVGLGFHF